MMIMTTLRACYHDAGTAQGAALRGLEEEDRAWVLAFPTTYHDLRSLTSKRSSKMQNFERRDHDDRTSKSRRPLATIATLSSSKTS